MGTRDSRFVVATSPGTPERKTTVGSVVAYLSGVAGLAVLNVVADTNLVSVLPDAVEVLVAPGIPAFIAFLAAYASKHTKRPDLGD